MVLLLVPHCAPIFKRTPKIQKEAGWATVTGRGVPTSYDLKAEVSTDRELALSLKVDGFVQEIKIEKPGRFQSIAIPGAGFLEEIGKPNLPVIRRLVAVPKGATVKVEIGDTSYAIRRGYKIYPAQEPVVEQGGPYRTEFTMDRKFYRTNQFYPPQIVSVSEPMIMGGLKVVQLEVFPVQYNPSREILKVFTELDVRVEFVDSAARPRTFIGVPVKEKLEVTPAYWKQYKHLVNIGLVKDFLVLFQRAQYLIITDDQFVDEITPLAEWKRAKGLGTKIVKMSTVGSSDADIRDYISNAYHHWATRPSWVLLVGDVELVPTHLYTHGGGSCASDLYYATVDGDDFLPDLAVGRFPAKTEADVIGMVAKTIGYEKTPVTSPDEWYSRVSLVSDEGYFENTSNWIHTFLTDRGYEVDRFYRSTGTATKTNIADAANEGRIILNYRGHGGVTGWATGDFRNADVLNLNNNGMLPSIITPTCQTGWFDHATSDCFGEAWLKAGGSAGQSGAVAFWGSSRNSYGGYNDELAKGVYKAAFNDGIGSFGDITNQAKLYMFDVYGTSSTAQLEFNLFNVLGDPELNVWFQVPTALPEGWKAIDLDILGSNKTGGVTKNIIQDVGTQNAFPTLSYPYSGSPACFVTFSVPSDWDGLSDFLVEFIWYSPTQDGNLKWSIVYDRKDASKTPLKGFNRHVRSFWGLRKERVSHSSIEMWSLAKHGPITPGDVITLGLERFAFNPGEAGAADAITSEIDLIAARVLYQTD